MTIDEILKKTGQTESSIVREHLLLTALSKLSRYEAECAQFEKDKGQPLDSFKMNIMERKCEEDFEEEDELMEWEFANTAYRWWKTQIEELNRAD